MTASTGIFDPKSILPDPGVHAYVTDRLRYWNVDVDSLPRHWVPLAITGTLEWVWLCGWWMYYNAGFVMSDAPSKYVLEYDGCEFDPEKVLMVVRRPEENLLFRRVHNPGISGKERTEALPYLRYDVFGAWARHIQADDDFVPPDYFLELAMWSVLMWILEPYGEDWIHHRDEVLACAIDYGTAYKSLWDNRLLDPRRVVLHERELGTCRYCGQSTYCVGGGALQIDGVDVWHFVCDNCASELAKTGIADPDVLRRAATPRCASKGGACISACRHNISSEEMRRRWEEAGSMRVREYQERIASLGAAEARQIEFGALLDYFTPDGR